MNENFSPGKARKPRRWFLPALVLAALAVVPGVVALANTGLTLAAAPSSVPQARDVREALASQSQAITTGAKSQANSGDQPSTCGPGANYIFNQGTGAFVPGITDIGNHGDDITTNIPLPFPVVLYKQAPFTTANISSNGNLQYSSASTAFTNACLPMAAFNNSIMPHWDDL